MEAKMSEVLQNRQPRKVYFDDYIMLNILTRLPAKSIGRFRCVSQKWLSLTTEPRFLKTHTSMLSSVTNCFYLTKLTQWHRNSPNDQAEILYLNKEDNVKNRVNSSSLYDPSLTFLDYKGVPADIIHSCNGLILCAVPHDAPRLLSVCNPTIRDHDVIPVPDNMNRYFSRFSLAFDPLISPHYKIFCILRFYANGAEFRTGVYIFSSQTRLWNYFTFDDQHIDRQRSVYCKGNLCWIDRKGERMILLEVDTEQFSSCIPLPMVTETHQTAFIVESRGYLHYVVTSDTSYDGLWSKNSRYNIYEMETISSGFSLKYFVNLDAIVDVYPKAKGDGMLNIKVFWFLREGTLNDKVGDYLLIFIPTMVVAYHLKDGAFSTLCCDQPPYYKRAYMDLYDWGNVYPHAHTLFPLNAPKSQFEMVCWKSYHDRLLISLMVECSLESYNNEVGFSGGEWNGMVKKFNKATQLNYEVQHLKNRFESYKKEYQVVKEILYNAGFRWSFEQQMVMASDGKWKNYMRKVNRTLLYKRKQVPYGDFMVIFKDDVKGAMRDCKPNVSLKRKRE